jgi:hypothetical protein
MVPEMVDETYAAFVAKLSPSLAPHARRLAHTLKLVPIEGVPWSRVFGHEVTLAAPALFAEAMPGIDAAALRDAVAAQTFAAIEAFGTDRIEDGQVAATPELRSVVAEVRRARDAAALRVCQGRKGADTDFLRAHERTLTAIATERRFFNEDRAVTFETYEQISLGKQSVGFPPTLALVLRAGWGTERTRAVHHALSSIWLGLQMPDDVVDWQDDLTRGGAWAYAIAKGRDPRVARGEDLEMRIAQSGVLPQILRRAAWHFQRLRGIASELGATRLARWAAEREAHTSALARSETENAGYASRAFQLIGWRTEVLT